MVKGAPSLHTGVDPQYGSYLVERKFRDGDLTRLYFARYSGGNRKGERYVIKTGGRGQNHEPAFIRRLLEREAQVLASLRHSSVVRLVDTLRAPDGPSLVLEYIRGVSLAKVLNQLRSRGVRLPQRLGYAIVLQLIEALVHLHAATDADGRTLQLRHCDIAPSNIMLAWTGTLKLVDFGISQWRGDSGTFESGLCLGTPGYLAPEQICGGPSTDRVDIFAAGILLVAILGCKGSPFMRGDLQSSLRATLSNRRLPCQELLGHCPPAIAELVERMLVVPAQARPSAVEVANQLRAALIGEDEGIATAKELAIFLQGFMAQIPDEEPVTAIDRPIPGPQALVAAEALMEVSAGDLIAIQDFESDLGVPPGLDLEATPELDFGATPDLEAASDCRPEAPTAVLSDSILPEARPAGSVRPPEPPPLGLVQEPVQAAANDVAVAEEELCLLDSHLDRGIDAIIRKDFEYAYSAFLEAEILAPENRHIQANLSRLRQLGFGVAPETGAVGGEVVEYSNQGR